MKAVLLVLCLASAAMVQALHAGNANSVLFLSSTVGSLDGGIASGLGYTVDVATPAIWATMTASDFASYRALFLGDPNCVGGDTPIAAAIANAAVWGPVVTGNVVIQGTDPDFHGKSAVIRAFQRFAANSTAGQTGLWLSLSCYYYAVSSYTASWMDFLKGPSGGPSFIISGQNEFGAGYCDNAHIVATSPALGSLTDADIANWGCSVHEGFKAWPTDYIPLAIVRTPSGGSYTAADGTMGLPYTLARGQVTAVGCQSNEVFQNGHCVPCPAGSHPNGGACVCDNGGVFPACGGPCGSGCTSKTIASTCESSAVVSTGLCASLSFDASSPC